VKMGNPISDDGQDWRTFAKRVWADIGNKIGVRLGPGKIGAVPSILRFPGCIKPSIDLLEQGLRLADRGSPSNRLALSSKTGRLPKSKLRLAEISYGFGYSRFGRL
jgi:hypothetical protein